MTDLFHADDNATPLTAAERTDLIPTHISLRGELNELEQKNVAEAYVWAFRRKRQVIDEAFLKGLHRRMFKAVWRWAGEYRTSDRNLGVEPYRIQPELYQIIADVRYAIQHESYTPDELAVRFKHRVVTVHPFPNGNGRWSRLAGDLLIVQQGGTRFTWGGANIQAEGDVRKRYIDALHAADDHDLEPLIRFARS
ncbi:MAG TPA: mobile mystery protein B [Bradyrhizobium sp.]|jgi:Fic-DOC domain mobile mystery protein B|nr:mobile mystery protein B [Bradyrhizobium sp.]